jgi:hypothetical protein
MSDEGKAEAIATVGLFLIFTAVIAVAFCVASWGAGNGEVAAIAGVAALFSFAGSIRCFIAQADETTTQELRVG